MIKSDSRVFSIISHSVLGLFSLACILPFLFMISASFTDELAIIKNGYTLIPSQFSLTAYDYLWRMNAQILQAYSVTFLVTIVGTFLTLTITSCLAYPLSRRDLKGRKFFTFFVVFTLLFNGGLVPTYLVYTSMLGIKNTFLALIIPTLLTNGFAVILMRTYFITSIPNELIESAKIDGAGEFRTFRSIVLPMSLPIIATVGLLSGLAYWNDWYNGLIYLTKTDLFSLQNLLNRIMTDIQALKTVNMGGLKPLSTTLPGETIRMAMAAIAVVPVLCAYPFFQKYFIKGITLGAVKG